jgi:prepilin-type N-terminal cleavage/methylation domain-containing protein
MRDSQTGFSLVEALIALLVLSIGLLGLGKLQARIWAASAQIYATAEATLLSASDLERSLGVGVAEAGPDRGRTIASPSGYAAFEETVRQQSIDRLQEVSVTLRWQDSGGKQVMMLQSAAYTAAATEGRWLLEDDEQ